MSATSHPSLKRAKQLIGEGRCDEAANALHSLLEAKQTLLTNTARADRRIMIGITKIYTLLGECYSYHGDFEQAENWFSTAQMTASSLTPSDDMLTARLCRQYGMHAYRHGDVRGAIARLAEASTRIELAPTSRRSERRRDIEQAYTIACQARVQLELVNGQDQRSMKSLRAAVRHLMGCGKPRYELDCLVTLIEFSAAPDPWRPWYIARAMYLNHCYVHNAATARRLAKFAVDPRIHIRRLGRVIHWN